MTFHRSLNAQLIVLVSVILFSTGAISGWVTAKQQSAMLITTMRQHATSMTRSIGESCAHYLVLEDYAGLEVLLLVALEQRDLLRLQVVEPDGFVVGNVENDPQGKPRSGQGGGRINPPVSLAPAVNLAGDELIVWQPIAVGNPLGWVKATYGLSSIRAAQADMQKSGLLLSLFWVMCSTGLLLLVLRPVVREIGKLAGFARSLDKHKGEQMAVGFRAAEIDGLAEALNYASKQLLSSEQQFIREQEQLRASEAKFRRIVDAANEGIWTLGPDLTTVFVNARMAEMLGCGVEEMVGRPVTDFMIEEDWPDHDLKMESHRQGMSETYERRYRRRDGSIVWSIASSVPLFDDEHRFAGSFAMFTDITERKRGEEALRDLIDELDQRVKQRTEELENKNEELSRLNKLFVGRELEMIKLKEKTQALEKALAECGARESSQH